MQRFFVDQDELLKGPGIHLIVGHRNTNKMILKSLLGLSFEEGFRVEQEHQRLHLYFDASKELWSYCVEDAAARFTRGYAPRWITAMYNQERPKDVYMKTVYIAMSADLITPNHVSIIQEAM